MIQAILSYQFILQKGESGVFKPEFKPVCLIFNNKNFSRRDYSELINEMDLFAIFYQHTTGITETTGDANKFYIGRLKQTPYQIISIFLKCIYLVDSILLPTFPALASPFHIFQYLLSQPLLRI